MSTMSRFAKIEDDLLLEYISTLLPTTPWCHLKKDGSLYCCGKTISFFNPYGRIYYFLASFTPGLDRAILRNGSELLATNRSQTLLFYKVN